MIVAIAQADVEEARVHHLIAAWSDLVTGDKPHGLVECLLMRGDDEWHVTSIWDSEESLAKAHEDEGSHPAFVIFDAADAVPRHTTLELTGRFAVH